MREPQVCNLLNMLSRSPWTTSLRWTLQITSHGEERVPFHLFLQSEAVTCRSSSQALFPRFIQLPAEIQLHILTFCSAPTLFHMMRLPMFRSEAAKLFWTDPNTFYLVKAYWLFKDGHPADTFDDISFMAHVRNVEVEYDHNSDNAMGGWKGYVDGTEIAYGCIETFWNKFRKRFPRAKRAVFNQTWEVVRFTRSPRSIDEPISQFLKALMQECPSGIEVVSRVTESEWASSAQGQSTTAPAVNGWYRAYYRVTDDGECERVPDSIFRHKTICMPHKRFQGPIGDFKSLEYEAERLHQRRLGLGALAIEALDRHCFDGELSKPFECPFSRCNINIYFNKAGKWTRHAVERHSIDFLWEAPFDILPEKLRNMFEDHQEKINQEEVALQEKLRKIHTDWNKIDGKKEEIELGWIDQMENDEAWNTGITWTESELWGHFIDRMHPEWEI